MSKVDTLEQKLKPGRVYRRQDLEKYSRSVDRHLQQMTKKHVLQKLAGGLYYYPKKTSFGNLPPEDEELVRAFLKDDNFYLATLNAYNSLGVGTSQLYNEKLVYNCKRDGRHTLNGRHFYFIKRVKFPKNSSPEFLLVDLVNNLELLAEDRNVLRKNVGDKAMQMDRSKLAKAVYSYGGARTKKFFEELFTGYGATHV